MVLTQGTLLVDLLTKKMAALGITTSNGVAVALSGGADSLSLALTVSWWSGNKGKVPLNT